MKTSHTGKAVGKPAMLRPEPWRVAKPRTCLRCTKTFSSPNAGVRLCPNCRRSEGD